MLKPIAPLAILLEGGYNVDATAASTLACAKALFDSAAPPLPSDNCKPSESGLNAIMNAVKSQVELNVISSASPMSLTRNAELSDYMYVEYKQMCRQV